MRSACGPLCPGPDALLLIMQPQSRKNSIRAGTPCGAQPTLYTLYQKAMTVLLLLWPLK